MFGAWIWKFRGLLWKGLGLSGKKYDILIFLLHQFMFHINHIHNENLAGKRRSSPSSCCLQGIFSSVQGWVVAHAGERMDLRFEGGWSFSDQACFFTAFRWARRSTREASAANCTRMYIVLSDCRAKQWIKGFANTLLFSLAGRSPLLFILARQTRKVWTKAHWPSSVPYKAHVQQKIWAVCQVS